VTNVNKLIDEKVEYYKNLPPFRFCLFGDVDKLDKRRIFLFGKGELGEQFSNALRHDGINIAGYIDNDKRKRGLKTGNIPCHSPSEIDWSDEHNLAVITVVASYEDVESQLEVLGCSKSRIFYGRKDRERLGKGCITT